MTQRLYDDRLMIADHPFIADRLTTMRDVDTPSPVFRENLKFIAQFLAYECLSDFPIEHRVVETPVQLSKQPTLPDTAPALISILRAGNYMVDGALALSPASPIGMVGLKRNEETLQPDQYFLRLPEDMDERLTLVCDPMLATGGSLIKSLDLLKDAGANDMRVLCLLAAPEGVEKVLEAYPGLKIWTASLDDHLNEKGYIVPGLGDAGDRIYGF